MQTVCWGSILLICNWSSFGMDQAEEVTATIVESAARVCFEIEIDCYISVHIIKELCLL